MNRPCQVVAVLFAVSTLAVSAASGQIGAPPTPTTGKGSVSLVITSFEKTAFAEVVLDDPALAACFLLAPGWWQIAHAPPALDSRDRLPGVVADHLKGVLDLTYSVTVTVAGADVKSVSAIVNGDRGLVLLPDGRLASVEAVAAPLSAAVLAASYQPAPAPPGVSEPLAALGEALARAGSMALATLPPALRPVHDWREAKHVAPALEVVVETALDQRIPWATRRARLDRIAFPGGASPELAQAAAFLVEAFGDAQAARREPVALLRAWAGRGEGYPAPPSALRKALERAERAGLPEKDQKELKKETELAEIAAAAYERALASATGTVPAPGADIPRAARLRAIALGRARGVAEACSWLPADLPAEVTTGCRSEGEKAGIAFVRPTPGRGSEVIARSPAGDEAALLVWPRWTLFPLVDRAGGRLLFIDEQGLWAVPLDASAPPTRLRAGRFRHLAQAPGGPLLATVDWDDGTIAVIGAERDTIAASARGGLAFLDRDVLLASDGERISLASPSGEVQASASEIPCTRALAVRSGTVLAAVSKPCHPGIVAASPVTFGTEPLLQTAEGPVGLVVLADGALAFGNATGMWLWPGGGSTQRLGVGLTPGPG